MDEQRDAERDAERAEDADPPVPDGLLLSVDERGGFAVPVQLNGKVLVTKSR